MATQTRTLKMLIQQGWKEYPEVVASTGMAVIGALFMGFSYNKYVRENLQYRRYRLSYTVYRPDDPRVKNIRE